MRRGILLCGRRDGTHASDERDPTTLGVMQSQHAHRNPRRSSGQEPEGTPFRAAFSRARGESLAAGGVPVHMERLRVFEYRVEKRRGKRKADVALWNKLGRAGWELVGVTEKHAAFKRVRTAAPPG